MWFNYVFLKSLFEKGGGIINKLINSEDTQIDYKFEASRFRWQEQNLNHIEVTKKESKNVDMEQIFNTFSIRHVFISSNEDNSPIKINFNQESNPHCFCL